MKTRLPRGSRACRHITVSLFLAALLTGGPGISQAANIWDGGGDPDGNWSVAANWDDNTVPVSGAALTFAGAINLTTANDLAAFAVSGLTFDGTAGAFTLGGNNLTLGGDLVDNSANPQTISLGLDLSATRTVNVGPGGSLAISGIITGVGFGLTKTGAGTARLSGLNTYDGITTFAAGVVSIPSITGGGIASGIGQATSDPANLVFDGGTLQWTGSASEATDRGFTLTTNGGTIDSSPLSAATNLTISGAIAFSGSGPRTLTLIGVDQNPLAIGGNIISSFISDGDGGPTTIVKNGNNAFVLTSSNTYSGGTVINEGRVRANTSTSAFGTGPVTVAAGAQAYLGVGGVFSNDFNIAGIGFPETFGNSGAIRLAANNTNIAGTVTLTGDARIMARTNNANNVATISGRITGPFNLELNEAGGGSANLVLSNIANDWTGNTTIMQGTVRLGASGVIPNGVGFGNVTINPIAPSGIATFDLSGFDETINGLNSDGDVARIVVTSAAPATLTVGDNNASGAFGGVISGAVSFTKIGTGTQTLSGPNTYSGDTTVIAGTLVLTLDDTLADEANVSLNNGVVLNLNFAGEDTVALLFINGEVQEAGTWGSDDSTAQFKSPLFAGTGVLLVAVPEPGIVALLILGAGIAGLFRARSLRSRSGV